jgi:hypothetical protein
MAANAAPVDMNVRRFMTDTDEAEPGQKFNAFYRFKSGFSCLGFSVKAPLTRPQPSSGG